MKTDSPPAETWAARTMRNVVGLAAWTVAWVATLALAKFGPGSLWGEQGTPTMLAIVFNVLIGIGMLMANRRHLVDLDELQRTIQLHAMAWALGAGLVGGATWTLLDRHGLVGLDASIGHLIVLMAVVYLAGCLVGWRRYR